MGGHHVRFHFETVKDRESPLAEQAAEQKKPAEKAVEKAVEEPVKKPRARKPKTENATQEKPAAKRQEPRNRKEGSVRAWEKQSDGV